MNDFFNTIEKTKFIQNKYKDCYNLYKLLKDSNLKTLMTTSKKITSLYGMFVPDKNIEYVDGKYKGRLTKKEEKKDFKYYFNEQNKVIMTERYSEGELLNIIFYFYNHDNIEIVFYSLREMSIAIIGEINYVDGKITDLFLTNNLSLFNEYGFNHFAYNKLLFTYNNNEVLMKRTRSFVDSIDIVYNDKTKFFFENKQKDIIPGTDKVIVTSSRETLI